MIVTRNRRRAVFLDRDGTLNVEVNYLHRVTDFALIPGAAKAVQALNAAGYLTLLVTNQAGIARGYYDEAALHALHAYLTTMLAAQGARLDAIYFCPHHPEFTGACDCRKPAPGMLIRAAAEHQIDLAQSWLIGDTASDLAAGQAAGCCTILVRTGYGIQTEAQLSSAESLPPTTIVDDVRAAVALILRTDLRTNS